jgi:hypothetical protein
MLGVRGKRKDSQVRSGQSVLSATETDLRYSDIALSAGVISSSMHYVCMHIDAVAMQLYA